MIRVYFILSAAILILSQAGNLIRLCSAEPLVIAFYRLGLAFLLIIPISFSSLRLELKTMTPTRATKLASMGMFFSLHLITWITALQHTTVANAAICFALNPIFISLGARVFFGERFTHRLAVAIGSGIVGMLFIGYNDLNLSFSHLSGDLWALLSALLFGLYFLTGKSLGRSMENTAMMTFVYFFGALLALSIILLKGGALIGFNLQTKITLLMLAIFPTILGHASLIYVLKYLNTSFVASLTLTEPILAGIVAFFLFGEALTVLSLTGYLIISGGLLYLLYRKN